MSEDGIAQGRQREILEALAEKFAPMSFRAIASRQALVRRRPPGEHIVHVAFIRHSHDLDLTIQVAARLDRLRPFYRASRMGVEPMLGAELGNMVDGRPRRWTVSVPAEVPTVSESIRGFCVDFALPWFDAAADLRTVFGWLRDNERRAWLLAPVPMYRGFLLVALAGVLDSARAASELAAEYSGLLREHRDPQAEHFAQRVPALLAALATEARS